MSKSNRKTIVVLGGYAESLVNFRGPMLKSMAACGCRVIACAPRASEKIRNTLAEMNVEYREIPFQRAGLNPFADFEGLRVLMALFRECRPDIVLSYTIKPVIYGALTAKLAGVNKIYSMITGLGYVFSDGSIKSRVVGCIASILYKFSLACNERVFFQNPDDRDFFGERGLLTSLNKAVLINGSGVDVGYFAQAPFPVNPSFLLIARLLRDKGIYEYVQAARILKERCPEISFRLVGWVDTENPGSIIHDELQSWVGEGVIEYLGRMEDVRPALSGCSVYVLPSYREGTPRTVLEAMSMGRPVITTDTPGCRETVVEGDNGFLVPVRDAASLARAMERFIRQPELIEGMGRRSREIAKEKYCVNKVNNRIFEALRLN
ncbi:glycosyltransferase family 4 protein [Desulfoluna spongiiphila]|uniref:glycosyltransferase family 4 protein n=1 Tax=Desulfoluna spongiiphila TaxID=419481 RepID=UPI00125F44B5|nr:glycosyltransferase family 4 protein [Desulfoluna spongiiphila]